MSPRYLRSTPCCSTFSIRKRTRRWSRSYRHRRNRSGHEPDSPSICILMSFLNPVQAQSLGHTDGSNGQSCSQCCAMSSAATPSTGHAWGHCTCRRGQWKRSWSLRLDSGPISSAHHIHGRVHTCCSWRSRSSNGTSSPHPSLHLTGRRGHSLSLCSFRSLARISCEQMGHGTPRHLHLLTSCFGSCVIGSWAPHPNRQLAKRMRHRKFECASSCGSKTCTPHNLHARFRAGHSFSLCCCKYRKGKVPPQLSQPVGLKSQVFNKWYCKVFWRINPLPQSLGQAQGAWPKSKATSSCRLCKTRFSAVSST